MARGYANRVPLRAGTEIVGRIIAVGSAVKKFKEGDFAAVGCMVNSCGVCPNCREGLEQHCDNGFTLTYNSEDKIVGGVTYGGYSDSIVVDESFALRVSPKVDLAATAPLLCAGITTYSPTRDWNVQKGLLAVLGTSSLYHPTQESSPEGAVRSCDSRWRCGCCTISQNRVDGVRAFQTAR